MQLPAQKWYEVLLKRRSRRQFNGKKLPQNIVAYLHQFSEELSNQLEGVRAVLVTEKPDEVFKGAVGSYGSIKNAPAYIAFIGDMSHPRVQEQLGYLGESFILEATYQELATCWVGGFFRPETVKKQISLEKEEKILAVSPVGYSDNKYTLEEKIMSGFAASHRRKSLEELCEDIKVKEPLPVWVKTALEAARLAPSAVNRQPWRFSIGEDSIKISVDSLKDSYQISKRLDCGIAMLHLEVGALHEGVRGEWAYLEGLDVAEFKAQIF